MFTLFWTIGRGRKWNPLRQRLDSYDYTVAQHVVGSLLFTPLLLLLPTTLVFYIFLTIMNTTIIFICMLIEIAISVIHATPYVKIILWLVRPKRFPSGVWFEIISCQNSGNGLAPETSYHMKEKSETPSSVLVSYLHSNLLKIGEVLSSHSWYWYGWLSFRWCLTKHMILVEAMIFRLQTSNLTSRSFAKWLWYHLEVRAISVNLHLGGGMI